MDQADMRTKAIALADAGFRVFPLTEGGKRPAFEGWQDSASSDPQRAHAVWSEALTGDPLHYNIGIATGHGLFVLDVDNKNGKNGSATLEGLELLNDYLPATLSVATPTGGVHYYLRTDETDWIPNSTSRLGDGLDIKGDGGYVVGPSSIVEHGTYKAGKGEIAAAPKWLTSSIKGQKPERISADLHLDHEAEEAAAVRAIDWLKRHAPLEGTYRVACRVLDFGVPVDMAVELLLDHWNDRRYEPKTEEQLREKVEHAAAYRHKPIGADSADAEFEVVELPDGTKDEDRAKAQDEWPTPTPLEDFDPHSIPPREWVVPALLARTFVTALISPGGTGKTQFAASVGLALSAGRSDILGFEVKQRSRVWYWNQEDDIDELRRRIGAVREHFGIKTADTVIDGQPGFFYDSGVERPLLMAKRKPDGTLAPTVNVAKIIEQIKRNQIDVFIADPFIEFHEGEENNNAEMAATWRLFRRIAVETRCAVLVSAHTKKPPDADAESFIGSMDSLRGASAQGPVVRLAYTLFTMTHKNAKLYGVPESQRHLYARMDRAKGNIFIDSGEPRWFRRESVHLGPADAGESLGVLLPAELQKGGAGGETDPLCIIAQALDDNPDFEDGRWYTLSEVTASMDAGQTAAFGSGKNMSRTIERAAKLNNLTIVEKEDQELVTDYGRLGILKKPRPGGFVFYIKRGGLK